MKRIYNLIVLGLILTIQSSFAEWDFESAFYKIKKFQKLSANSYPSDARGETTGPLYSKFRFRHHRSISYEWRYCD